MKYSIIGTGIIGQELHRQAPDSVLFGRNSIIPIEHDVLVVAAPTGNRLVVNNDPEKDLADCDSIIKLVSQCRYNQLVYTSTVDVYRTHNYGDNRRYLESVLATLPNSHVVRLPSLIGQSVNKNILYDLKTNSWLDKICLDSTVQWYPLSRLKNDIENAIKQQVKYQNLFSEPIFNHEIVQKFFPELVEQLATNRLASVNYDIKPYTIPLEEIWQSFDKFFVDHCAKSVYNKQSKENYMSNRTFSGAEQAKLTQVINEGMQVTMEIETLTGGLNDTVKAIAEELDIKPNILKKAIKLAHKSEFGREQQDHELLEQILVTVGKTL